MQIRLLAANHTNLFTDSDRKQNASCRQHTVRPWDDSMITDATRNIAPRSLPIHNEIYHILWSTLVTSSSDETTCSRPTILHSPVNSAGAHSGAFHGWAQHASSSKPTTHPSNQKHQDDRGNSKTLDLWAVVKASTSSSHTDPLCSQTAVLLRCQEFGHSCQS